MERIPIAKRPTARVERLVRTHVGDHPELAVLFGALLAQTSYQRSLALAITDLARRSGEAWPVRRAATLMLEHCLLRISPDDRAEHEFWFRQLGIDDADVSRFRRRLERLARVHGPIAGFASNDTAIGDFFHIARRECRLTLAPRLWNAEDVIGRIEKDVRRSGGIRSRPDYGHRIVDEEASHAVGALPPLDRAIVKHLGQDAVMRWVSPETSNEINSLVEFPVGTVVVVIKPPGSDREIEIKRAGVRDPFPLDVVFSRGGNIVPTSHFLHGGSMEHLLAFEASQSSILSRLYRAAHGIDAPMSRTIHLATVFTLPSPEGETDVVDYFTEPRVFRDRYKTMRANMDRVVTELSRQTGRRREPAINDLMLTAAFLGEMKPAQAVQIGTTSFRLERLGSYMQPNGDERYFSQSRKVEYTRDDSRRFADEVLDEILCVYEPPRVPFRNYARYLDAAFALRANRQRANRNYMEVMQQIGRFWGTLVAARGHSSGESFVGRNAGLRSVFENGEWRIRIIFMDHDSVAFASRSDSVYHPFPWLRNEAKDGKYILGAYLGKTDERAEIDYLRDIYRVNRSLERRGLAAMRMSMKAAYHRTQDVMCNDPEVRKIFRATFIEKLRDWDEVVRGYLSSHRTREQLRAWRSGMLDLLRARGYSETTAGQYVRVVVQERRFLKKIAFLF